MTNAKRQWLVRTLAGAGAGVAAHLLVGCLLGCFSLTGPAHFSGFVFPYCNFPREIEPLGVLLSFALFALFGAGVGAATLPFADSGRELVARSLLHYVFTAATVSVWVVLNFGWHGTLPTFLIPLTLVYALVWLGRWVGWFTEAAAIREKLGLAPGPSPLHWRESLPHVGFAAFLCLALPLLLWLVDDHRIPVLSVLYCWLLLPVGGFMSGLSLGRRHGFCPVYPAACALFSLLLVVGARLLDIVAEGGTLGGTTIFAVLIAALAGNLAGAARHKIKTRRDSHDR